MNLSVLDSAHNLARLGWFVFPLHDVRDGRCSCDKANCKSQGKHPRTKNGCKDATTDAAKIRDWWGRWPVANIGVATGPESGIWMLGPDGEQGIAELAALVRKYSGLPRTPMARSGSGGRHYYWSWPADGNIVNRKKHRGTEIDVRGAGGLFVAPPSRNANGPYVWEVHPDDCEVAEAPAWLLEWCRNDGNAPAPVPRKADNGASIRNAPSVTDRAVKYLATMPPAVSGQGGHDRAMAAARIVVWGFDLGPELGYHLLAAHYNPLCLPPWSERELRHKCAEADSKPFDKPRGWLLDTPNRGARCYSNGSNGTPAGVPRVETSAAHAGVIEAENDPHRLARLFLADHRRDGKLCLHLWRHEWYVWEGVAYRVCPEEEIRAKLGLRIKREFDDINRRDVADARGAGKVPPEVRKVSGRLVADVLQALKSYVLLPHTISEPSWLGEAPVPASEVLGCRNVLLHLPSWAEGRPATFAVTPDFFSRNALDYGFDPEAPKPARWSAFLDEIWPDDADAIAALQEWFGYCLLPDTCHHKIFLIVGPRRGGKGTIARVLTALLGGEGNFASPTLSTLGSQFGLWPLLGKKLAIISDARLSGRTDVAVVVERLVSISGEDAQTVDRKGMPPVTTRLPVRFLILTNELPKMTDHSAALAGRMIVLRQTKDWYNREDKTLTGRLLGELPGILLWALAGWKRLRDRGRFEQPLSGGQLVAELENLSSPIGAFVRDCCEVGTACEVVIKELYDHWRRWCENKGQKEPGTEPLFGRNLRAHLPTLESRNRRIPGIAKRQRVYVGLRLRSGDDEEEYSEVEDSDNGNGHPTPFG